MREGDSRPMSELYRLAAEEWVDRDAAATILEELKTAFLSKRMAELGDMAVNKAERIIKSSAEWHDYITKMVNARKAASKAKVQVEFLRMKAWEAQSAEANARAERRM